VDSISVRSRSTPASRASCCCQAASSARGSMSIRLLSRVALAQQSSQPGVQSREAVPGHADVPRVGADDGQGIGRLLQHVGQGVADLPAVGVALLRLRDEVRAVEQGATQAAQRHVAVLQSGEPGAQLRLRVTGAGPERVKAGALLGAGQRTVGVGHLGAQRPGPVKPPVDRGRDQPCRSCCASPCRTSASRSASSARASAAGWTYSGGAMTTLTATPTAAPMRVS